MPLGAINHRERCLAGGTICEKCEPLLRQGPGAISAVNGSFQGERTFAPLHENGV